MLKHLYPDYFRPVHLCTSPLAFAMGGSTETNSVFRSWCRIVGSQLILLIMNVFLLVMGMFLDLTPAVLIFVPIFLPITRKIGMSDVHFGLMLITNLGIGSVTPPVGSCLFVGCGVAKVKIEGVTKYIIPIFASMVVALFLVTYIPQISLSLPYWTNLIASMGWN